VEVERVDIEAMCGGGGVFEPQGGELAGPHADLAAVEYVERDERQLS
jgi:hypothetical protein